MNNMAYIKKILVLLFILQFFILVCNGHSINITIEQKTFEIKTLYNNNSPIINQKYIIYYNLNSIYEKYFIGKTNTYGCLFFDLLPNIINYQLIINSGEHSINNIFEAKKILSDNNFILKNIFYKILFGLNWTIGIFGGLFYFLSKKNKLIISK